MSSVQVFCRLILLASLVTGCASSPPISTVPEKSALFARETELGTHDDMAYHALVHYPSEHRLKFPGMIVGVEKSSAASLKREVSQSVLIPDLRSKSDLWLGGKIIADPKVMFISHVVRGELGPRRIYAKSLPCYVYNVYGHDEKSGSADRSEIDDIPTCHNGPLRANTPFWDSWKAIERIKATLSEELQASGHYTHVVLIVMGWNTQQIESVQNYNSIVERLATARGGNRFVPYVIGVTWPSEWYGTGWDSVARPLSLGNKANDADELGAGWLGAILDHAILPAITSSDGTRKVPLMVIGHSFGARATSQAVCRGTLLRNPLNTPVPNTKVDWLIGLSGAYSLNRFTREGAGLVNMSYADQCSRASNLLFTASKHDQAARLAQWMLADGNFAGTQGAFETAAKSGLGSGELRFATFVAEKNGALRAACGPATDPESRFRYVDASDAIFYNAYATGAGAHSDIYRKNTANLIWNAMSAKPICTQ